VELKLSDGLTLSFTFGDLIDALDPEKLHELASSLACDEVIINSVVDLLVKGYTDSPWSPGSGAVEAARLRVLEKLDEIAYEAIQRVIYDRETARANEDIQYEWARRVWNAWPSEHRDKCPKIPDRVLGEFWERERVLQELARAKGEVIENLKYQNYNVQFSNRGAPIVTAI